VELVLFPALLGLELFALKSWCRSFCPLGAFLSIIGSLNRFFRPAIKQETCLASKGTNCQACRNACPEGIDLRNQKGVLFPTSCTKCLECYEKCPARAIKIAVLS
jgi:ferredoxin-type protein NapH